LLAVIRDQVSDDRAYKLRVREEVLPFLVAMENRIDREHFEGVVADALDTTKDAIHFEVERMSQEGTDTFEENKEENVTIKATRGEDLVLHLLGILLWQKEISEPLIDVSEFENRLKDAVGEDAFDSLLSTDESKKSKAIFEVEELYGGEGGKKELLRVIEEQLLELKDRHLRARLRVIHAQIKQAEIEGDSGTAEKLLLESAELQKGLQKG
jgi:hypothetical protein